MKNSKSLSIFGVHSVHATPTEFSKTSKRFPGVDVTAEEPLGKKSDVIQENILFIEKVIGTIHTRVLNIESAYITDRNK